MLVTKPWCAPSCSQLTPPVFLFTFIPSMSKRTLRPVSWLSLHLNLKPVKLVGCDPIGCFRWLNSRSSLSWLNYYWNLERLCSIFFALLETPKSDAQTLKSFNTVVVKSSWNLIKTRKHLTYWVKFSLTGGYVRIGAIEDTRFLWSKFF